MRVETVSHARAMLEAIQKAVDRKEFDTASRLERELWLNTLEVAAVHICRNSPSDLCATALTSRQIKFPRGYNP